MTRDEIMRIITEPEEQNEQPILPKDFTCNVKIQEGLAELGIYDAAGRFRGTYLDVDELTEKKVREAVRGVIASLRGKRSGKE
jgi:hypothetical protein